MREAAGKAVERGVFRSEFSSRRLRRRAAGSIGVCLLVGAGFFVWHWVVENEPGIGAVILVGGVGLALLLAAILWLFDRWHRGSAVEIDWDEREVRFHRCQLTRRIGAGPVLPRSYVKRFDQVLSATRMPGYQGGPDSLHLTLDEGYVGFTEDFEDFDRLVDEFKSIASETAAPPIHRRYWVRFAALLVAVIGLPIGLFVLAAVALAMGWVE